MIPLTTVSDYLHDFLAVDSFNDYAPNGLQVQGKPNIGRIATAVTASLEAIQQAIAWQADVLLVHHGYFWKGENPIITGMKAQRLSKLLEQKINLLAYHLPLDCHPTLGNNACIANLLGLVSIQSHKVGNTKDLLWSGLLPTALNMTQCKALLEKTFQRAPLHVSGSSKSIHNIAWCSGAAQDYIEAAKALGVDAFISGEVSERTYYQARELDIHYFACGHHATERFGIQALGEHLANQFQLDVTFLDSENPV